ncbi:MAG: hypothetical protein M3419_03960 [Actinomycetota bacterium]|nr:hypothetical protein [Actinomycetota bacterium]
MARIARIVVGLLAIVVALVAPASAGTPHAAVVSDDPVNVTPNVQDDAVVGKTAIHAFAQVGSTMYAGGSFHRVTDAQETVAYTRDNLMSFNAGTGAMTSFAPSIDGPVWAIRSSGSSLYVAGAFKTVNGVVRRGVVKLDASTGAVDTAFNARLPGGKVTDMHLVDGRLLIGGTFPKKLAAVDPGTGADTGYVNLSITGTVASNAGATDVYRFAVNPGGDRLVAIGNFTSVGGQARRRAFMLTLGPTSATVNPWYYQPLDNMCGTTKIPQYLRGVDFSPDGSYFVFASSGYVPLSGGVGRDLCDATARFETSVTAPVQPTWINYTGGDTLHSVVATGAAVYVQGHQRWLDNPFGRDNAGPGAVSREGIGAIDPSTGLALPWNPGKTRAVGGKVLYATPDGLWVGSDGARFAGEYRDNIAFCPL